MLRGSRLVVRLIPLLSVGLCAALAAEAAATLVAARSLRPGPLGRPSSATASIAEPRHQTARTARLPPRNIFCSTCAAPAGGEERPAQAPTPAELDARLVATMIGEGAPSLAVISAGERARVRLLAVGDRLAGQATVIAIAPRRVLLRHGARVEYLALDRGPPAPPSRAAAPASRAGTMPGLRQLGPQRWELRRAAVQRMLADPRQLARSVLVVPTRRGWLLRRVRPRSPVAALGLRSGDTLEAVNGQALGSPARDLELLVRLLNASRLQLAVRRGGASLIHDYVIR